MAKGFRLTERAKRAPNRLSFDDPRDVALMRACPVAVFDDRAFGLHGIRSPCLPPDDNVVRSRSHVRELEKKYNLINTSTTDARKAVKC